MPGRRQSWRTADENVALERLRRRDGRASSSRSGRRRPSRHKHDRGRRQWDVYQRHGRLYELQGLGRASAYHLPGSQHTTVRGAVGAQHHPRIARLSLYPNLR